MRHLSAIGRAAPALPALALLAAFVAGPLVILVRVSLYEGGGKSGFGIGGSYYQPGTWTLANYRTLAGERYFRQVFLFSTALGMGVTALTLALSLPIATGIRRLPKKHQWAALLAVLLPKLANILVLTYGLELVLSNIGPINRLLLVSHIIGEPLRMTNNLVGVVVGKTYLLLPYAVLILLAMWNPREPELVQAARGLAAGPWTAFRRVTVPLAMPGLTTAGLVTLIWALAAFVSPTLLGTPEEITLAMEVQRQAFENLNWPRSAATAVVLLGTAAAFASAYSVALRIGGRRW
jgi:ABC-type spermidine/putrescine transport system permease subunit I